ncbi:DUF2188 domain-containing protein [Planococcus lenghuensis]|uniref:DUF2188 domain-containing protein n=1 Tax=Planococcus lenghuensis TaxID=2213202 RepID=A0A1Q2KUT7_9BACL|nr:DUF2188 domain-containing protein [Planococcus lenghuensis]AQQ51949.1 hypothetical protein B0X71_01645 [Planococcus lenghuensis]
MNRYVVEPNKDASRWIVTLEGVAPDDSYPTKSGAIDAAEELAKANTPSKVIILDDDHNEVEERTY